MFLFEAPEDALEKVKGGRFIGCRWDLVGFNGI